MKYLIIVLSISGIFVSHFFYSQKSNENRFLLPPIAELKYVTFGYKDSVADSLWIRLLQDIDYCENKNTSGCRSGWVYQMLDVITEIVPKLRMAYATGPLCLDILVGDSEGATKIYEKGVKEFPTDWPILYRAAYHYLYETPDSAKAAQLLEQAGRNGAPAWVFALAARLYTEAGMRFLGENMLASMVQEGYSPELIEKVRQRIETNLKKKQVQ